MRRYLALEDFERDARRRLPRMIYGFIAGGAETNAALRGNRRRSEQVAFRPRVLTDVSKRSTKTTLFGKDYAAPFGIAPMGAAALCAFRGDLALAARGGREPDPHGRQRVVADPAGRDPQCGAERLVSGLLARGCGAHRARLAKSRDGRF